jgi:hypothetical protein
MDEYHLHKPYEACSDTCPGPRMDQERADDWWDRYVYAKDENERKRVNQEAMPGSTRRGRTSYVKGE